MNSIGHNKDNRFIFIYRDSWNQTCPIRKAAGYSGVTEISSPYLFEKVIISKLL